MKAKQFFYIMIVAIILGFAGIAGAFYWGDSQLKVRANKIADLQADRDIAREKIIKLNKAEKSADLADEATSLLDNLLPKTKDQEKLVADVIYTASAEAKIPINNLSNLSFSNSGEPSDLSGTEQSKDVPGVFTYPFNLTVQNISYSTLLRFLKELENNGRLVQVADLQISPDKTNPGQVSSVSLSLKAFLKP